MATLVMPDSQRAVLGAVLTDYSLLNGPFSELTVSDFVGERDQEVYRTILKVGQNGEPFDNEIVVQQMEETGIGANRDWARAYITELITGAVPNPKLMRSHVGKLQRFAQLRRLGQLGEQIGHKVYEPGADPSVILQQCDSVVQSLRNGHDLDGNLLPYSPRSLSWRPEILRLAEVQPREVDWLWQPYLPAAMLAMLSGDPGAGKTYVSLSIAADLTCGRRPFSGESCAPSDVLYLSMENSLEHVVRPRFDLLHGDPTRFHALRGSVSGNDKSSERRPIKLSDIKILEKSLRETKARLVIVDPIQSYLGAEVDAHRSNETRPVLDGLARIAAEYGACFLLVRHFAKSLAARPIHRGLGSVDLTGAVRSELHAGSVEEQRALVHAKSNLGQLGKSLGYAINEDGAFRWTGETDFTAGDLQSTELAGEDRSALEEAVGYLSEALAAGPRSAKEVQSELRAVDVSPATLRRAKGRLRVLSRKTEMHGGWEWSLPEGVHHSSKSSTICT